MGKIIDMGEHFTTGNLLRYATPSMAMVLFTSIYGIVDGFFISNYAGKTAFAAVNLIMPFRRVAAAMTRKRTAISVLLFGFPWRRA